jgi:DNA-binding transcriptional regulator GbsR (MarR family)
VADLTPAAKRFVLHWGEMGSKWGVNRTVGQIHALLYLSPEPLPVKVVHVLGDRRDHYEAMQDVWEMVRVILDERKKREFDPTLAVLRELTETASGARDAHTHERLAEMLSFFESVAAYYAQMRRLPTGSVIKFVKMGDKVRKLLGLAS